MRVIGPLILLAMWLLGLPVAGLADDVINVRISVKVIRSIDGRLPDGVDLSLLASVIQSDLSLPPPAWWRGYRFVLVDPITPIGGDDPTGPSRWFDVNFFDEPIQAFLETASVTEPAAYAWNPSAINIYVNNATGRRGIGGLAPCSAIEPPFACVIMVGGGQAVLSGTYLHEIGHVFGLAHTQGVNCGACNRIMTGVCHTVRGDDRIADTLPDLECFTPDAIALFSFGTPASRLPPPDLERVLDVFENVMSYHLGSSRHRLTELQLDRWADFASDHVLPAAAPQNDVVDGRTLFVEADPVRSGRGSSQEPFLDVNEAVAAANPQGGDILLFRPGSYPGPRTFDRAVTLRATRAGAAVLGEPRPPPPPLRCPNRLRCCPRAQPDGTCTGQCWPADMLCP
jgi:hypothetical protein